MGNFRMIRNFCKIYFDSTDRLENISIKMHIHRRIIMTGARESSKWDYSELSFSTEVLFIGAKCVPTGLLVVSNKDDYARIKFSGGYNFSKIDIIFEISVCIQIKHCSGSKFGNRLPKASFEGKVSFLSTKQLELHSNDSSNGKGVRGYNPFIEQTYTTIPMSGQISGSATENVLESRLVRLPVFGSMQ